MRHRICAAYVVVALLAALVAADQAGAGSLRCRGMLIEPGDLVARLLAECGEPNSRGVVAVQRATEGGVLGRLELVETWTYPAANTRGFQTLRFQGGRLVGDGMRCGNVVVHEGDIAHTVIEACGEPLRRDASGLAPDAAAPAPSGRPPIVDVPIEQWIYDRGAGRFLAVVTVEGARITAIEDGRRR